MKPFIFASLILGSVLAAAAEDFENGAFSDVPPEVRADLKKAIQKTITLQKARKWSELYDQYLYRHSESLDAFTRNMRKSPILRGFSVLSVSFVPPAGEWLAVGCAQYGDTSVRASISAKRIESRWFLSLVNLAPVTKGVRTECAGGPKATR